MREQWDFPFEREAASGMPVPEGLSPADQMAYTALRNLYWAFNAGRLDRERAGADKRRLRRVWEQAKEAEAFERKLNDYHVRLILGIEQALSRCRKNPTEANALYLCDVLDGLERPDVGCVIEALRGSGRGLEAQMKNDAAERPDGPKTKACGQTEGCERNAGV